MRCLTALVEVGEGRRSDDLPIAWSADDHNAEWIVVLGVEVAVGPSIELVTALLALIERCPLPNGFSVV